MVFQKTQFLNQCLTKPQCMGESENYFGIKSMKNNPLDNAIKQKLSLLWFLDPDTKAADVRTMTHTYIWHPQANSMVKRLGENLLEIDQEEIEQGIMEKILNWGELNGFPTYKEIQMIDGYLSGTADMFIRSVLNLLIEENNTNVSVCFEFLDKYTHYLSQWEIDAVLDQYLKGIKLNESHKNQLLLNFE